MNQTSLDFWPQASRNSNPASSFIAERKVTKSGKRASVYQTVLGKLKTCPKYTAAELAYEIYNKGESMADFNTIGYKHILNVRRRLWDAKTKNQAVQCGGRICRVCGNECETWEVI